MRLAGGRLRDEVVLDRKRTLSSGQCRMKMVGSSLAREGLNRVAVRTSGSSIKACSRSFCSPHMVVYWPTKYGITSSSSVAARLEYISIIMQIRLFLQGPTSPTMFHTSSSSTSPSPSRSNSSPSSPTSPTPPAASATSPTTPSGPIAPPGWPIAVDEGGGTPPESPGEDGGWSSLGDGSLVPHSQAVKGLRSTGNGGDA
mmetsp:Transcript_35951/g.89612  ORF Transcript_35951/g.89612 Transcript_35951/m.89612 type:complete len:200 (+) Transcript_35951:1635-2234(+)